jgi:transposase
LSTPLTRHTCGNSNCGWAGSADFNAICNIINRAIEVVRAAEAEKQSEPEDWLQLN